MNPAMLNELQSAATEAQSQLGTMATLAGVAISCVCNSNQETEDVLMGGRLVKLQLTVVATRNQSAFTNLSPTIGQLFVFDGVTYKLLGVNSDDVNYILMVGQPSQ